MDGADGADGWTRGYGKSSAVPGRTGGQGVWDGYVRFVTKTINSGRGVEVLMMDVLMDVLMVWEGWEGCGGQCPHMIT